jgi:tetratricopeptide (TPR) repeat protein
MPKFILLLFSLISCAIAVDEPHIKFPEISDDLVPWTPPEQLPTARKRITDIEYMQRRKEILANVDRMALTKGSKQLFAGQIIEVTPGSQAQQLGMRVNDLILSLDDQPIVLGKPFREMRTSGEQTLALAAPSGVERRITIQPGKLGFRYEEGQLFWRASAIYLQSSERDERWDDNMLVACQAITDDAGLVETAIAHAQESGYHGPLGLALMEMAAASEFRFDDALAFGMAALQQLPQAQQGAIIQTTIRAARTSGHLGLARQLGKRYPAQERVFSPNSEAGLITALPVYVRTQPSPITMATQRSSIDLSTKICAFKTEAWWQTLQIPLSHKISIKVPSDHYQECPLGPRVQRALLSTEFTTTTTDSKNGEWPALVSIGLDIWNQNQERIIFADINFRGDGYVILRLPQGEYFFLGKYLTRTDGKPCKVTVAAGDGVLEFLVDGQRVFLGPTFLDSTQSPSHPCRFSARINVVSWNVDFFNIAWKSIGESASAGQLGMPNDFVAEALVLEKKQTQPEEVVSTFQRAVTSGDWNAKIALGDYYQRHQQHPQAIEWYEKSLAESSDSITWLKWAVATLDAHSERCDDVLKKIAEKVPDFTILIVEESFSPFFARLRRLGKSHLAIPLLESLRGADNPDAFYELFMCHLVDGNWQKARTEARRLLVPRFMKPEYRANVWAVDAALAVFLGQPPPDYQLIQDMISENKLPKCTILALRYFMNEIDDATVLQNGMATEYGEQWIHYRGLKAFALRDFLTARRDFAFIIDKHSNKIDAEPSRSLNQWMSEQKPEKIAKEKNDTKWPFTGTPAQSTPTTTPAPPPGDNDF